MVDYLLEHHWHLVGEGAGTTASNPEVVAPLDKLKGMINNNGGGRSAS